MCVIPDKPLLNTKQVAEIMGKSPGSIARLCRQERIPGAVFVGGSWLINREKLLEFLGIEA